MNHMNKVALAVATLGCMASTTAYSQAANYNPSWYISPSINSSQLDTQIGADKDLTGGGLKFGKALSPSWDVQLGVTGMRTSDNLPKFRQSTLGIDALYMLSRDMFRPFVLLGTGFQYDRVDLPTGFVSQTSPYLSLGAGVQAQLSDQWALQLDYRRNHAYLDNTSAGSNSASNNYLTLSVNYAFGKSASPAYSPPPAPMPNAMATPQPAPYVAPAPAPAPIVAMPQRFERYTLSATELFGFDSAQLQMPQPKLDEIAAALNSNRDINGIVITGYTDRLGSDKYNQALSERRANAVKDYLIGKGLAESRLSAQGKGEANPVVTCTEKNRAALIQCLEPNRRVEVDQITLQRRVQ